jgi:phage tail-like protein
MKRDEIARLLPGIFQRTIHPGNPLSTLLAVMEALHEPSEDVLERLDTFFDPYRAPDDFIPFLAAWVDLERLLTESPEARAAHAARAAARTGVRPATAAPPPLPTGLGRLRELVAAAAYLSQWRGTARGLLRFLETATGVQGFEIDEQVLGRDGRPRPFHLRIRAPQETAAYRPMLERIVELEKPAYVTYELEFGP